MLWLMPQHLLQSLQQPHESPGRLREVKWLAQRPPSRLVAELRPKLPLGTMWTHLSWGLTGRDFRGPLEWHWWGGARRLGSWVSVGGWDLMKSVPPPLPPHLHSGSSGAAASPWMPWD